MYGSRYLVQQIEEFAFDAGKMAFISGPRQCGKTTMSKDLLLRRGDGGYYNWDEPNFRKIWGTNPRSILEDYTGTVRPIIILDELHKAPRWKQNIKGLYDVADHICDFVVTGSARLNVYRKGGDSLLGRYFHFRLHPFSLAEAAKMPVLAHESLIEHLTQRTRPFSKEAQDLLLQLDQFGGFPEPFLAANKRRFNVWQRGRIEKIIREDLRDLSRLPELSQVEVLVSLLPERVSSPLSLQKLAHDLEVAYTTVKRWLSYLKELYYCFEIRPYNKQLARAIKKEGKWYLWDWSEIKDEAKRFENLIACHLYKYVHYLNDLGYGDFELCYIRTKEKKEIDFLILKDGTPWLPVEVKLSEQHISPNWKSFMPHLPCRFGVQVVKTSDVYLYSKQKHSEILVLSAAEFLGYLV